MKDTSASQSFLCSIVVEVSQYPSTMNTLNVAQFSPFNRRLRKCSGSGSSYVHPFPRQRAWLCAQRLFSLSPPPPLPPSLFILLWIEDARYRNLNYVYSPFIVVTILLWYYLIRNANAEARIRLISPSSLPRFRSLAKGKSRVCLTRLFECTKRNAFFTCM